jgi:hypothetical protein
MLHEVIFNQLIIRPEDLQESERIRNVLGPEGRYCQDFVIVGNLKPDGGFGVWRRRPPPAEECALVWQFVTHTASCVEATLGNWPLDGVLFSLQHLPSCHRRGPFRLIIEICSGEHHHKWGCFDDSDQPVRHYHDVDNARYEAQLLADVLWRERITKGPLAKL